MSSITRTWLAFAGVGAGLIHLAMVVGSPLPLALFLGAMGLLEFGWGIYAFAASTLRAPRAVLFLALVPVLGWALLVTIGTALRMPVLASAIPFLPMGLASVLGIAAAVGLAVHLRRNPAENAPRPAPSAGRYLVALMAGALLVAGITTPALAATEAGLYAQPHGEHTGFTFDLPEHGAGHR